MDELDQGNLLDHDYRMTIYLLSTVSTLSPCMYGIHTWYRGVLFEFTKMYLHELVL